MDRRLRMARNEAHLPFGGLCIILCGDFAQLPPVGATSLMTAFVHSTDPTTPRRRAKTSLSAGNESGLALIRLFTRHDLTDRLGRLRMDNSGTD
ncbi:MAG: hypothetical protein ACP5I8_13750 [Phycisphaerae bacterium]